MNPRVIPCLLLNNNGLAKTIKFKNPQYLGDPINAVKIFNEKEVDELIFLDINATVLKKSPPFKVINDIASECFMPLCYGGAINNIKDIHTIFKLGVEKVSINTYAIENPTFIREASDEFGSQSIVVSIDVKKNLWGKYEIYTYGGRKATGLDPVKVAIQMQRLGAGELFINSIDRDGTMRGYDIELISKLSCEVSIPIIACGGAGNLQDLVSVIKQGGASAAAAGSLFLYKGKHRALLLNYPSQSELNTVFS